MSETKFTKGPWVVSEDSWLDFHRSIDTPNHGAIALILSSMSDKCDKLKNLELKANANLIACAPDMYDALETIKRHILNMPICDPHLYGWVDENIDPLLKRARGE